MVWVWKIITKNVKFFNFFPLGQKNSLRVGSKGTWVKGGSASYLLRVKSQLGLGQGPSLVSGVNDDRRVYLPTSLPTPSSPTYQFAYPLQKITGSSAYPRVCLPTSLPTYHTQAY